MQNILKQTCHTVKLILANETFIQSPKQIPNHFLLLSHFRLNYGLPVFDTAGKCNVHI